MDRLHKTTGLSYGIGFAPLLVAAGFLPNGRSQQCPAVDLKPASTVAAGPLLLARTTIRVELKAGEQRTVVLPVLNQTEKVVRILSLESACHCVRAEDHPAELAPGKRAEIYVALFGVMAGVKTLEIVTDGGRQAVTFQVVVDGHGLGRDTAAQAARQLSGDDGLHALAILHDLRGEVRGCGCSGSALGGLEKVPALAAEFPQGRATWLATGDALGGLSASPLRALLARLSVKEVNTGATAALRIKGRRQLSVVVSDRPEEALEGHDLVITSARERPRNSRVLIPQFERGMGVDLYLLDRRGFPAEHYLIPLDASFRRDGALAKELGTASGVRPFTVAQGEDSRECAACHPRAYEAWRAGPHARAFDVLKEADRMTACVVCHTTEHADGVRVRQVQCQACHEQCAAHQRDPRKRTVLRDCLSCHDGRHHPDFDPAGAWRQTGRCPVAAATYDPGNQTKSEN
jgi:hypothetical protein